GTVDLGLLGLRGAWTPLNVGHCTVRVVAPRRPPGATRTGGRQSTSIAWRPPYQPQFPQTTCGSFTALQRGQVLRGAGLRVQFAARRLRLLDFEVFFFGTAIGRLCSQEWRGGRSRPVGRRTRDV